MDTLRRGARFGKYHIERSIGQGGMGVVYVAEDTTLGRRVALKVLQPGLSALSDFEDRFRREARIVASLNHPNIVQIHALEKVGAVLAIDMMYVDGGSLEKSVGGGRRGLLGALQHIEDALTGLVSCHRIGVVHRDVKPSNILVSSGGRALISDFGLSKCLAQHNEMAMASPASSCFFLGTPRYAPPESWDGKEPTPAWDVYSMGAILYEMAGGRPPYEAKSPFELIKALHSGEAPPLSRLCPDISDSFSAVVGEMLASDPAQRPQDAGEALERLASTPEFEKKGGVKAPTIAVPRWPRRRWRARQPGSARRLAVLGAVGLVCILAAVWGAGVVGMSLVKGGDASWPAGAGPPRAAPYYVLNTTDTLTNKQWPNHWLMKPGEQPGAYYVLASRGTDVWYFKGKEEDGRLSLNGFWAEYTDQTARAFRHGRATGEAKWVRPADLMTATLTFDCVSDGSRWHGAYLLDRVQGEGLDRAFLENLEDEALVPRLVYGELAPRRLAWAEELEDRFLVPYASRAFVPAASEKDSAIVVDGKLDEAFWRCLMRQEQRDYGVVRAASGDERGLLLVMQVPEGVYFGVTLPGPLKEPKLTLGLLCRYALVLEDAAVCTLVVDETGLAGARRTKGGRSLPWESGAQAAMNQSDGNCQTEIFVPYEGLDMPQGPEEGERWRVSCFLKEKGRGGAARTAAVWGAGAHELARHGAILAFSAAR